MTFLLTVVAGLTCGGFFALPFGTIAAAVHHIGRQGQVSLAADFSLDDFGGDGGRDEFVNIVVGKEGIGDVFIILQEIKEEEGSVLPVFKFDLIQHTARPSSLQSVELGFQCSIVNQLGFH